MINKAQQLIERLHALDELFSSTTKKVLGYGAATLGAAGIGYLAGQHLLGGGTGGGSGSAVASIAPSASNVPQIPSSTSIVDPMTTSGSAGTGVVAPEVNMSAPAPAPAANPMGTPATAIKPVSPTPTMKVPYKIAAAAPYMDSQAAAHDDMVQHQRNIGKVYDKVSADYLQGPGKGYTENTLTSKMRDARWSLFNKSIDTEGFNKSRELLANIEKNSGFHISH